MQTLRTSFCNVNQPNKLFDIAPVECNYELQNEDTDYSGYLPALSPIRGTVAAANLVYASPDQRCIVEYEVIVKTPENQSAHFTITGFTYLVDCGELKIGAPLIGFYDTFAPIPAIYPPTYNIYVLAFDFPNRRIKADFFDCYLISQDRGLKLVISNNTYVVDKNGLPYCDTLSNKYLVVLYDDEEGIGPVVTTPNVVIVLN